MWNHQTLSPEMRLNKALIERFKKNAKISGIIFILLGLVGIVFPTIMSLTTLAFVTYMMLFAGAMSAWMTATTNKNDWTGWLKSFILIGTGLLMLFYPLNGIAALGLLFSIYFFMDAFAGFGIAFSLKPKKGWWVWLINAITSLVLGALFAYGWPVSSIVLVGLFVGISLTFDGVALLTGAKFLDAVEKEMDDK
jgi:uncharacterized membrane protein HdeD (DUF308 family)